MKAHSRWLFISGFPVVTLIMLGGCLVGFAVELVVWFTGQPLGDFLVTFGVVPVGLVSYFRSVEGATFLNSVMPFFSSLFIHGGFLHLLTNVLYLWVVGDVLEDWLGATRLIVLFLFGAAGELLVRIGASGYPSGLPSVGVSGAVAALIGGYIVVLSRAVERADRPVSVAAILRRVPLYIGVVAWFPLQLLNRYLAFPAGTCQTREPVAWLALSTGFLLGVFLVSLSGPHGTGSSAEATAFRDEREVSAFQA